MAIRVAVVTGSSSGSSNARDDTMVTVRDGQSVGGTILNSAYVRDFRQRQHRGQRCCR